VERDDDGDGVAEQVDRYTYDEEGHLIAFENGERVERYRRDRSGRVAVRESRRRGSPLGTSVIVTYDAKGRPVREVSDVEDVRYGYDSTGREVHEERYRPGEDVAYLAYVTTNDVAGRPLLQQGHDPNGPLHKTWRYDERGREMESEWVRDGSLLLRTRTSYDAAGRKLLEEQLDREGSLVGRESWTYDSHGEEASHRTESLESREWIEERYTYTAPMKCAR
jgi:YD repeat-containing protein